MPSKKPSMNIAVLRLILQRGLAQGAVFLSTLFAARYIGPGEFGQAGLFTSACSFFAMASSMRFEVRALVSRSLAKRRLLFGMAYVSNIAIFFLLTLSIIVCGLFTSLPAWAWLLPCGVALSSLVQYVFPAQNSTAQDLSRLGLMIQFVAAATAGGQLIAALVVPSATSLTVARVLGWTVGVIFMGKCVAHGLSTVASLRPRIVKRLLRSSGKEILYGIPASLISVVSLQVPVYVFSFYSMGEEVGFYWFAFNLLFMPYLIISTSIRPLFIRQISETTPTLGMHRYLWKMTGYALGFGAAFSAAISAITLALAKLALPPAWSEVPLYTIFLAPLLILLVAQTPISFSIPVVGLQRVNFYGGTLQVVMRTLAMVVPIKLGSESSHVLLSFSIVAALTYAGYIMVCMAKVK